MITVNIRFLAKTSNIRNFYQNIRSDVKTSEVATLVAGHFHLRKFIAGHKRFYDVTISYCDKINPLILIRFMR